VGGVSIVSVIFCVSKEKDEIRARRDDKDTRDGDDGERKRSKDRRRNDSRDRDRRRRSRSPRRRRRSESVSRRKRSNSPRRRRSREREDRDRDRDRDRDEYRRDRDRDRDRDRYRDRRSRSHREEDEKRRKIREEEEQKKRDEEERKRKEEEARYQAEIAAQVEEIDDSSEEEEASAEKLAEERRKKRAAIMAKFAAKNNKKIEEEKGRPSGTAEEEKPGTKSQDIKETKEVGEDDYDLFSDDPEKIKPANAASKLEGTIDADNFTDSEGYYVFRAGDMLNDRFRVTQNQGRGVFSTVLRVQDTAFNHRELVIKVVRGNESMYKSGLQEVEFLKLLAQKDPEGKKHCVRLLSSFEHRNHLCMVFEPMYMNLRELTRSHHGGISIMGIQIFAKQLFLALRLCKQCQFIHGDIKPDNILVNKEKNQVKLCDFGSAGYKKDAEITPYLCSRFYRAPEIILGILYDEQSDIWSVGCVLYEIFTSEILYPGKTNNDMLRYHMEYNGNFPKRMIKKGKFKDQHFDGDQVFLQVKTDPLKNLELKVPRKDLMKPTKSMFKRLKNSLGASDEHGKKKLNQLHDLLKKMFNMDPSRRLTVDQCLHHPFIKE